MYGPQICKKSTLECSSQRVMLVERKHRQKMDRGLKGSRIHDRAIALYTALPTALSMSHLEAGQLRICVVERFIVIQHELKIV